MKSISFLSFSKIKLKRPSMAGWQSGYAAVCNIVYAGSIPTPASIIPFDTVRCCLKWKIKKIIKSIINGNILYHFVPYKFLVSGIKWGYK